MRITPKQYGQLLYEITHEKKKQELEAILRDFVFLLVTNKSLSQLPRIIHFFKECFREVENIEEVEVVSARPLPHALLNRIKKTMPVDHVVFKNSIDPALIGGMIIKHNDTVLDESVQSAIAHLGAVLSK